MIGVPPKRDARRWRELRDSLDEQSVRDAELEYAARVRVRHMLEQQIVKVESRQKNAGRARTVRDLKRRLAKENVKR